jgi:pimeloyl-ACP methyl ester carboxylesterase
MMTLPFTSVVGERRAHVEVNGIRLHYLERGDPRAQAVVVLHGIMGHCREWDVLTDALATRFRSVAVDQRGHGQSDWTDTYTVAAFAGDVVALIEQLGLAPAHVVGHSLGAMAAMVAAASRPELVDRVVLIDVGPESLSTEWADELPATLDALAEASYAQLDDVVEEWLAGNDLADRALMRHYIRHCLKRGPDGRLVWRFDGAGLARFPAEGVDGELLWRAVDGLAAPTLLLRGQHSPLLPRAAAESVVERLRDGRLEEIPDAGHDLGVEQPAAVAAATARFLGS